jgi:hypothetical protein
MGHFPLVLSDEYEGGHIERQASHPLTIIIYDNKC